MSRPNRIFAIGLGIAAITPSLFLSVGCDRSARGAAPSGSGSPAGSSSAGADRPVPVTVAPVVRKDVAVIVEGLGTVTPLATVTVKSQVDGRLDRVLFKEGDAVKKGDVLAQIDPRPFAIQLETGQAGLARDTANLKNSQVNLDRYATLRQQNLIPEQQLTDQKAAVDQLAASAKADQATIESARLNLDYARIVSPVDGVTGIRLVDPGNIIHATDTTGIVIVTQLDPISVIFTLPQDELPRVQKAMKTGKLTVDAYARDDATQLGAGDLTLIDNQVNAQTATIRLKAVMPNGDKSLWPNQFVKARLHLETRANALVVPASTIQRGPKGAFAYVVGPDNKVLTKPVEVSSIEGDEAIVSKGLSEGDSVVTDGQNQLRPGAKISPRPPSGASSAAPAGSSAAAAPSGSGGGSRHRP